MMRNYIVGSYYPQHPSLKANMYKIARKSANTYAKSIGRELAEGPTVLYLQEFWSEPVEIWPLVVEGGD